MRKLKKRRGNKRRKRMNKLGNWSKREMKLSRKKHLRIPRSHNQ